MVGPQTTRNGIVAINPRTTRADEACDRSPTGMNDDVSRPDMMPSRGGVRGMTESNKKAQYQKLAHRPSPFNCRAHVARRLHYGVQ